MEKKLKKIKSIWFITKNIITLFVALGAFSVASTRFETIVVAGLLIIILNMDAYAKIWMMAHAEDNAPDKENKEAFDEYLKGKELTEKIIFISTMFSYLIYLITIFNLVVATLS